ncbi:MAG: FliA/WhiG family RNA polymerase sigma factor [Candidatus Margulisbacteria bacterium]|nr:FliA/WhiG family RNA polymerase sigma factor [Candidatus Margulisiibacteriota bacterium]
MITPLQHYNTVIDEDSISKLVEENLALVKYVISRMEIHLPSGMDKEDLVSIGNWGLIEAARHFDVSKNVKFQTYAYIKIKGAILDEIRKSSFGGQTIVRKQKQLMDVYTELEQKFNRLPTDEEVALALHVSPDKLEKMLEETSGAYLVSLDNFVEDDDNLRVMDRLSTEDDYLDAIIDSERTQLLTATIEGLAKNEKLVLSLYYEQELSLKEISLIMDLSESRISQIHKKAIFRIKSVINNS